MSNRDTYLLLQDMLESAEKIHQYTDGYDYESFVDDDKTIIENDLDDLIFNIKFMINNC